MRASVEQLCRVDTAEEKEHIISPGRRILNHTYIVSFGLSSKVEHGKDQEASMNILVMTCTKAAMRQRVPGASLTSKTYEFSENM